MNVYIEISYRADRKRCEDKSYPFPVKETRSRGNPWPSQWRFVNRDFASERSSKDTQTVSIVQALHLHVQSKNAARASIVSTTHHLCKENQFSYYYLTPHLLMSSFETPIFFASLKNYKLFRCIFTCIKIETIKIISWYTYIL